MKIFGLHIPRWVFLIFVLIVLSICAYFMFANKVETFSDGESCQALGSYTFSKCGDEIKVVTNMNAKENTKIVYRRVPAPSPSAKDEAKTESLCAFPLEPHGNGCQLRCPTSTFLLANPNVLCQHTMTGEIIAKNNGKCPDGYKNDPAGCVKPLTTCPPHYTLIGGACQENCPEGSVPDSMVVEMDNNGDVVDRRVKVCRVVEK